MLEPPQKKLYHFMRNNEAKITVIKSSRRIGKSTSAIILAIETCIKNPNQVVKYLAPYKDEMQRSLLPTFKMILENAPEGLRLETDIKYSPIKGTFTFPNGSEIQISPAENNRYRSLRGGACHLAIVDEAGFISNLKDALISTLLPTTATTQGRVLVISTPPEEADHYFVELEELASLDDSLMVMTIDDYYEEMDKYGVPCTRLPKQEIELQSIAMGGRDSNEFKREYLCELITSDETKVVPEFTRELEKEIVKEYELPPYYDAYTAMDIGVKDMTVVLFAYYDFANNRVVIADEFTLQGAQVTTDKIAEGVREKETFLWRDERTNTSKPVRYRFSDNDLRLIQDLNVMHGMVFVPTEKHNKVKYINELRQRIASGNVHIHPQCKTLLNHLRFAQWDKNRKDFKRTKDSAHADGVAALMYLIRNINWNKNPYPPHYQFRNLGDNVYISSKYRQNDGRLEFQEQIRRQLKIKSTMPRRNRLKYES